MDFRALKPTLPTLANYRKLLRGPVPFKCKPATASVSELEALEVKVCSFGFRVLGFGVWVLWFEAWVSGSGFEVGGWVSSFQISGFGV